MAYVELQIDTVIKWCENTLDYIEQECQKEIDERVKYWMTPTKVFGFTICRGMSEEEARRTVDRGETFEDVMAGASYWVHKMNVKYILRLCKLKQSRSGETVITLSSDDLKSLITD